MQYESIKKYGEAQHGLVTRAQLLLEWTPSQISHLVTKGALIAEHPSVYRIGGSPHTWLQKLMAAQLRMPDALISHRAALLLYGISDGLDDREWVEVSVPNNRSSRTNGVKVHRTDKLYHGREIEGLQVVPPERALIDCGTYFGDELLKRYVDNALFKRVTTFKMLRFELDNIAKKGRKGVGVMRALLEEYDPTDEKSASDLERLVRREILQLNMPEPVSQWEVWVEGRQRFLDFAYPELKIGIEAHSMTWHTRLTAFENDDDRDGALTAAGWRMFYVNKRNMEAKLLRIKGVLPTNFVRLDETYAS